MQPEIVEHIDAFEELLKVEENEDVIEDARHTLLVQISQWAYDANGEPNTSHLDQAEMFASHLDMRDVGGVVSIILPKELSNDGEVEFGREDIPTIELGDE